MSADRALPKASAGLLLYRLSDGAPELLLVHPGGPFWAGRDHGAWTIPKGEIGDGEEAEAAARREFAEELGAPFEGRLVPLGEIVQRAGKRVIAFAGEGDFDVARLRSNSFEMAWPPRSGRMQSFPEVDRAAWFPPHEARRRLNPAQAPLVDALEAHLATTVPAPLLATASAATVAKGQRETDHDEGPGA